jgi:hypothetical protein
MNRVSRLIAFSAFSLALIPFVSGCGESESSKQIKETSTTTSFAQPAPAPMVVAQPPSQINTTEEKSSSHSTEMGNNSTAESTDAYHSESTTVTPAPVVVAPAPAPPTMQSQTTEKKIYKETTD